MSIKISQILISAIETMEESGKPISLSVDDINVSVKDGNINFRIGANATISEETVLKVFDSLHEKQ